MNVTAKTNQHASAKPPWAKSSFILLLSAGLHFGIFAVLAFAWQESGPMVPESPDFLAQDIRPMKRDVELLPMPTVRRVDQRCGGGWIHAASFVWPLPNADIDFLAGLPSDFWIRPRGLMPRHAVKPFNPFLYLRRSGECLCSMPPRPLSEADSGFLPDRLFDGWMSVGRLLHLPENEDRQCCESK